LKLLIIDEVLIAELEAVEVLVVDGQEDKVPEVEVLIAKVQDDQIIIN